MKRTQRRQFLKDSAKFGSSVLGASLLPSLVNRASGQSARPNVLFISIDDLNDCPVPFGGSMTALTPNISSLAARGVVFQNAFTPAPYCGAARAAVLTGAAPYRTGSTSNQNILEASSYAQALKNLKQANLLTIPRYFKSRNYRTYGAGKVYHGGFGAGANNRDYDEAAWSEYFGTDFNEIANAFPGVLNYRDHRTADQLRMGEGAPGDMPSMIGADYNTLEQENMMPDKKVARWGAGKMLDGSLSSGEPFFMALGFYRPHIAMYVPQRFYDLYPIESIRVPNYQEQIEDLRDLPEYALKNLVNMEWTAYGKRTESGDLSSDHYLLRDMALKENRNGHAQAIQAYLASVSFVDECVGQVLTALDHSGLRDNTIVVLWSDHGWFLGEKLTWQKFKLWDKVSRVPLIVSVPNGATGNCNSVVSSLDLFPTLIDLTGGTVPNYAATQLDGRSLRANLAAPSMISDSYAITTQDIRDTGTPVGAGLFHSIRTARWRYIKYPPIAGATLSEELYDISVDPHEKKNLLYWEPQRFEPVRAALATLLKNKTG